MGVTRVRGSGGPAGPALCSGCGPGPVHPAQLATCWRPWEGAGPGMRSLCLPSCSHALWLHGLLPASPSASAHCVFISLSVSLSPSPSLPLPPPSLSPSRGLSLGHFRANPIKRPAAEPPGVLLRPRPWNQGQPGGRSGPQMGSCSGQCREAGRGEPSWHRSSRPPQQGWGLLSGGVSILSAVPPPCRGLPGVPSLELPWNVWRDPLSSPGDKPCQGVGGNRVFKGRYPEPAPLCHAQPWSTYKP